MSKKRPILRINIYNAYAKLFSCFGLTTLLYRFWPPINRVVAVFIVALLAYSYFRGG